MNAQDYLLEGERLDDLQNNGYKIIQNPRKFCFGMDAVLLSSFTKLEKCEKVLDMGTGTGVLPILLSAKTPVPFFEGLEIQEESADMARRSVAYNQLEERIHITTGNLITASALYGRQSFDAVVTNPPYMNNQHGLKNPHLSKAIARHEILCTLEDVIRESALILKPKKSLFLVHRPFRLVEIFQTLTKYHLEPKRMCLVYPYIYKEPNMVLIEASKDGNPGIRTDPPIIIYESPGVYSRQISDLYNY